MQDTPTPQRGRPKDPAKRAAILEAAKQLFLQDGYHDTSMEAVARVAGVSKLTVYSHFTDKASLFATAVHEKTQEVLPLPTFRLEPGTDLTALLNQIGVLFLTLITSEEAVAVHRLLASSTADPSTAILFFEAGPRLMLDAMEALLRQADALELLRIPDAAVATDQLYGLLQGCRQMQVLIGCAEPYTAPEKAEHVQRAVQTFMAAYQR